MTLVLAIIAAGAAIALIVYSGRFGRRVSRPSTVADLSPHDWSVLSNLERTLLLGVCMGICAAFLLFVRSRGGGENPELLLYGVGTIVGVVCAVVRKSRFDR